jgi:hypothetical protein
MDKTAKLKDFLFSNNWFDLKYAAHSTVRFHTFKAALNLFLQNDGTTIVETGCTREKDDWGAGYSTVMLGDFCQRYDAYMWTVDISGPNLALSKQLTQEYGSRMTFVEQDSAEFFRTIPKRADAAKLQKIDLLYLDSFDYPVNQLLYIYGYAGKLSTEEALAHLRSASEEEIVELCKDFVSPSQNHCLAELTAALSHLHDKSVILIDDNDLPGGGKSRLAKIWLQENGYTCLLDRYQTLWIKRI